MRDARHRHQRAAIQAPERVRAAALRLRRHVSAIACGRSARSFPARPERIHWSIADPALERGDGRAELSGVRAHRRRDRRTASGSCSTSSNSTTTAPPGGDHMPEDTVSVRYMVNDVEAPSTSTQAFRVHVGMNAPGLRRCLPGQPAHAAERPAELGRRGRCPTVRNRRPVAGTASTSSSMTSRPRSSACAPQGVRFRNDIISGPGGRQILLDDPAGNPIELFQPAAPSAPKLPRSTPSTASAIRSPARPSAGPSSRATTSRRAARSSDGSAEIGAHVLEQLGGRAGDATRRCGRRRAGARRPPSGVPARRARRPPRPPGR